MQCGQRQKTHRVEDRTMVIKMIKVGIVGGKVRDVGEIVMGVPLAKGQRLIELGLAMCVRPETDSATGEVDLETRSSA